ncbi:MAG: hypothetical protein WAT81_01415 [Candidatus Moraniibacteriota bacterium]
MSLEENQEEVSTNRPGLSGPETQAFLEEAAAFNRESRGMIETIRARRADVEARGKSEQTQLNTAIESELDAIDGAGSELVAG